MRVKGQKLELGPSSRLIVFERQGRKPVAFRITAITNRDAFDKIVKVPDPPKKRMPGPGSGRLVPDPENPKYQAKLRDVNELFLQWMLLTGVTFVPGPDQEDEPIEWEMVKIDDPSTWGKWEEELAVAGFSHTERLTLFNAVGEVNTLSEARMDEARNSFLLQTPEESENLSSPEEERSDMPSGEPANGSESSLPAASLAGTTSTRS